MFHKCVFPWCEDKKKIVDGDESAQAILPNLWYSPCSRKMLGLTKLSTFFYVILRPPSMDAALVAPKQLIRPMLRWLVWACIQHTGVSSLAKHKWQETSPFGCQNRHPEIGLSLFVICPMNMFISGPARLLPLPLCSSLCLGQRFLHIGTNASIDEKSQDVKLWIVSLFFGSIVCAISGLLIFRPVDGWR